MRLIAITAAVLLGACAEQSAPPTAPAPAAPGAVAGAPDPVRTRPPTRAVQMRADPPAPFTYWAPDGATIRNHGNPGVWIAYVEGRQVAMYFGDGCGASGLQHWIGMPVADIPAPAEGEERRVFSVDDPVTDDLRPDRLNVAYDPRTRRIISVSCV